MVMVIYAPFNDSLKDDEFRVGGVFEENHMTFDVYPSNGLHKSVQDLILQTPPSHLSRSSVFHVQSYPFSPSPWTEKVVIIPPDFTVLDEVLYV